MYLLFFSVLTLLTMTHKLYYEETLFMFGEQFTLCVWATLDMSAIKK